MNDKLLKPADVAARLNISRRSAYYLIANGELPSVNVGAKLKRVSQSALDAYIENGKNK